MVFPQPAKEPITNRGPRFILAREHSPRIANQDLRDGLIWFVWFVLFIWLV